MKTFEKQCDKRKKKTFFYNVVYHNKDKFLHLAFFFFFHPFFNLSWLSIRRNPNFHFTNFMLLVILNDIKRHW